MNSGGERNVKNKFPHRLWYSQRPPDGVRLYFYLQ